MRAPDLSGNCEVHRLKYSVGHFIRRSRISDLSRRLYLKTLGMARTASTVEISSKGKVSLDGKCNAIVSKAIRDGIPIMEEMQDASVSFSRRVAASRLSRPTSTETAVSSLPRSSAAGKLFAKLSADASSSNSSSALSFPITNCEKSLSSKPRSSTIRPSLRLPVTV